MQEAYFPRMLVLAHCSSHGKKNAQVRETMYADVHDKESEGGEGGNGEPVGGSGGGGGGGGAACCTCSHTDRILLLLDSDNNTVRNGDSCVCTNMRDTLLQNAQ